MGILWFFCEICPPSEIVALTCVVNVKRILDILIDCWGIRLSSSVKEHFFLDLFPLILTGQPFFFVKVLFIYWPVLYSNKLFNFWFCEGLLDFLKLLCFRADFESLYFVCLSFPYFWKISIRCHFFLNFLFSELGSNKSPNIFLNFDWVISIK